LDLMAIRAGKKLPDKRGFVDGPGGYRGRDDRSHGNSNNNSSSSGSSGSGGGNFNTNTDTTPGNELSAMDQMAEAANIANQMADAGYVEKNFNLTNDPLSNFQQSMALNAPALDPTVPNALFGTNPNYSMQAPNPNLAAESQPPIEFQGFPALFSGIADAVDDFTNSPLGNLIGMATNPAAFFGGQALKNIYSAYSDEDDDTGLTSALGNTFQQSTPFGEMLGIDNPFSGVPNAGSDDVAVGGLNTTTEVGDTFSMAPQSFFSGLFSDANYGLSPEAQEGSTTTPVGVAQQTYGDPTGAASYNFGAQGDPQISMQQLGSLANQDFANQGGYGDFTGMSQDDIADRRDNRGPVILPSDLDGINLPIEENPLVGYGTLNPGANYNQLYGFNQGGRVPPMSGPMSNGLGNLFKMK
jgi:hypothetical protein